MTTTRTPALGEILQQWGRNLSDAMARFSGMNDGSLAVTASEYLGLDDPMTPGAISNYRNAHRCPGPDVQIALATALGMKGRDLFPLDLEDVSA